jgi:hypothetical protein
MPESSSRAVPIETPAAQTGLIFMVIFLVEGRTSGRPLDALSPPLGQ